MEKPLVNKKYLLEKYQGKGGWTYTILPGIPATLHSKGGLVKVKGFVDDFEIKSYNLFPLKGNPTTYFFPVKAEIRKKIKKEAGDYVHIVLYADNAAIEIPEELLSCLMDTPEAHKTFLSCSDGEKKAFIEWIYSAKTDQTKVERIARTLNKLGKGKNFRFQKPTNAKPGIVLYSDSEKKNFP